MLKLLTRMIEMSPLTLIHISLGNQYPMGWDGLKKSGVEPTAIQDLNFEKSSFGQEVSQMDSNLRLHDTTSGRDLRPS